MSQFKGMSRHGRRVRVAAMIVGAALALPSLAVANHTTCTKQSNEVGAGVNCPKFAPGLEAIVGNRVVDSETSLNYQFSQADHESQLTTIEAYAPKYWQFNTQLRPSTATSCATASTANAEVISNAWQMRILLGQNRGGINLKGNAYFLSYDAGTQTISACAQPTGSSTYKIPFTISAISGAHPYAATAGWKISIDLKPSMPKITEFDGSLVMFTIDLNQRSAGNWNQNQAGGSEKAVFSRASSQPVTTDLRADLSACRHGLNAAKTDCSVANDAITVLTQTDPFNVSPAATGTPLDFAHLTGPGRIYGAEFVGTYRRDGFGLVKGSNTANVTWTAPPASPDETVKGYALILALVNNQGSRYGKYIATPATSTILTAGSLPRIDGNGSLHPDLDGAAKYDISLITIFASGKRTDGLCDDGTATGVLCPATLPLWNIKTAAHPLTGDVPGGYIGTSYWQFLWRTKAYGSVTMQTNSTGPFLVLFVDYTVKEAELVIWGSYTIVNNTTTTTRGISGGRASEGPGTSFKNRSNLINGQDNTGVVSFTNGASPTGTALRFDFNGNTDPTGSNGLISLLEPGDVNLGTSVPPSPSVRRPTSIATFLMGNLGCPGANSCAARNV